MQAPVLPGSRHTVNVHGATAQSTCQPYDQIPGSPQYSPVSDSINPSDPLVTSSPCLALILEPQFN
ncbi:hypothetical protein BO86DRAFT_391907 [Aspergillus japonicus CBS 114.51]|uniref:Uncharacterized protein n=2 Tax=Aspergillus TaxID=5052 RepID=A0A2V5HCX7_ASPV1|nr:hypothetical protein BO86DRAFT_391907 [Aspergillus japonicus CBS 114.51]PYI21531.1 hypothetical protein BO99DRAFT_400833 [Aspergillus violaceofuscus CBS 115571]RAH78227.1 hypothetical protein BO86DRAFT_391907 [Aspergillus japonicus CBS 114.51]